MECGRSKHLQIICRLRLTVELPSMLVCCLQKSNKYDQSVSQIRVAFAAVATALHCERSCARENVWVRDMPVSEEM